MTADELRGLLSALDLSREEAAQLLGVSKRTVTRWSEGEDIPGPAVAALRAWLSLKKRDLAWKPDSISVLERDSDQIERQRLYAVRLAEMLSQVEARGGAKHPWKVDTFRSTANFGAAEVTFYKLANGSFSIGSYRRADRSPDLNVDMPLIQDAAYCIAREFARFGEQAKSLSEMASYVRQHANIAVTEGPNVLTPRQAAERKLRIERLAAQLEELAEAASEGSAIYLQYEDIEEKLHELGFFPTDSQVAAIARAFL